MKDEIQKQFSSIEEAEKEANNFVEKIKEINNDNYFQQISNLSERCQQKVDDIKEEYENIVKNIKSNDDQDKQKTTIKELLEKLKGIEANSKQILFNCNVILNLKNEYDNLFNRLIKFKKQKEEQKEKIETIIDGENGIRTHYCNALKKMKEEYNKNYNLYQKVSDIYQKMDQKIKKYCEQKGLSDYYNNIAEEYNASKENNNESKEKEKNKELEFDKKFKKENQIKIDDDVSKNSQDNKKKYKIEQECTIEDKKNDNEKNVVQEAEKENNDRKEDQQGKENKIIITEPNEKKKSNFLSYKYFEKRQKRRKKNMEKIRNETRKRTPFNYDRCNYYTEKYIEKFSHWDPTIRKEVENYQHRNLYGKTALNTTMDKGNDKPWRWGVCTLD